MTSDFVNDFFPCSFLLLLLLAYFWFGVCKCNNFFNNVSTYFSEIYNTAFYEIKLMFMCEVYDCALLYTCERFYIPPFFTVRVLLNDFKILMLNEKKN